MNDFKKIEAELAEDREFLEGLRSGDLYFGHPNDDRIRNKISELERSIAERQALLDGRHS